MMKNRAEGMRVHQSGMQEAVAAVCSPVARLGRVD